MIEMQFRNVGPGRWYVCAGRLREYVQDTNPVTLWAALRAAMARLAARVHRGESTD